MCKKLQQSAQQGPPGNEVKYHVQMFFFYFLFFVISCAAWRTHFWEYQNRFCDKQRDPVRIDFLGSLNLHIKNFPLRNPPNHEFLDPLLAGQFSANNAL